MKTEKEPMCPQCGKRSKTTEEDQQIELFGTCFKCEREIKEEQRKGLD